MKNMMYKYSLKNSKNLTVQCDKIYNNMILILEIILIKRFWNVSFRRRQLVTLLKRNHPFWERKVFIYIKIRFRSATKRIFLITDGNEISYFNIEKVLLHCRSETNRILNEVFLFPKCIVPFQKRQLVCLFRNGMFKNFLPL